MYKTSIASSRTHVEALHRRCASLSSTCFSASLRSHECSDEAIAVDAVRPASRPFSNDTFAHCRDSGKTCHPGLRDARADCRGNRCRHPQTRLAQGFADHRHATRGALHRCAMSSARPSSPPMPVIPCAVQETKPCRSLSDTRGHDLHGTRCSHRACIVCQPIVGIEHRASR